MITADTGYANEDNMRYLHENEIDGYIPDHQFRSRDPKFSEQKEKYNKPRSCKSKEAEKIPTSEFELDPVNKTCCCPAGERMWLKHEGQDLLGNQKLFFAGRLTKCRSCELKKRCMRNPESVHIRTGNGRQMSFTVEKGKRRPNYTDWMKHRVDSRKGKVIYSHRMSVVEPVFGNIGTNKGLNRLSLRGRKKVQGQWQLYCMVHNIEKLANYRKIAA